MVPQPQYTTAQKYAVIQYVRETFLRPPQPLAVSRKSQPAYVAALPRGLAARRGGRAGGSLAAAIPAHGSRPGRCFGTFEIAPRQHRAKKASRCASTTAPGGVSKGRAWMIYDHDTMRVCRRDPPGIFVDWKGNRLRRQPTAPTRGLTGERQFVNPVGPGWGLARGAKWDDARLLGKDQLPLRPACRAKWGALRGPLYLHGGKAVIAAKHRRDSRASKSPAGSTMARPARFLHAGR